MIALSLGSVLLFTAARVSLTHMQVARTVEDREQAKNLAESAVAESMQQILLDEGFGLAGQVVQADASGYPNNSLGLVSFRASSQVPRSTNNLRNNVTATGGLTTPVPANTVELVGYGRVGEFEHRVQVIFYRPPFPKALTASGRIAVSSSVSVTGMDPSIPYPSTSGNLPSNNRLPASLCSNDKSRDPIKPAIYLGASSFISGDLSACGSIQLASSATVAGEVRQGTSPQPIPNMDLTALISQAGQASGTAMLSGSAPGLTVSWYNGCDGDLTVNGDIDLKDDGVLWVKGNLTVTGGIKGKGLILVGRNVEVDRGASLSAQNMVALAAGGNVTLDGAGRNKYFLQGLVYSEGDLKARDITVLGSMVVNGPPGQGGVDLANVDLIEAPITFTQAYGQGFIGKESKNRKPIDWPGGGIAFTPVPSLTPQTPATRLYDVKIHVASPSTPGVDNFIFRSRPLSWIRSTFATQNWSSIKDDNGNLMKVDDHNTSAPFDIPHDEGMFFCVRDLLPGLQSNQSDMVLDLDFSSNRVLSQANRARVLLWRDL